MSDLNLIDVVNLIRAEIARTEIGDVKRITGPSGPQGPMGDTGPQGPQGPRGNDGAQGPAGIKGNQGKKGDKGVKGDDGADGVGIARVEQDLDNAIVVYLTDGNYYTIEMPLIQDDGSLAKEVHFKSGGSGGGGVVDLSGYVKRPHPKDQNKWMLYNDKSRSWAVATTDLIETNPDLEFRRDSNKGVLFSSWPEEADLSNQLKVNRYLWERLTDLEDTVVGFGFREIPNGNRTLKHDPALNSHGGPVNPEDCLIYHLDIADCTTEPCQKLVFVFPEGQELIDHYEDTQQESIFKLVQTNPDSGEPLQQAMRGVDGGSMSGDVFSIDCDQVFGDSLLDGVEVQILVRTAATVTEEWVSQHFVHRKGGDSMEGPLNMTAPPGTDSRAGRRIHTLGVYSNSASSALQLGTATTKVYVGDNDTSFNGPIKVSEITDRGNGIKIEAPLNFGQQSELMRIHTDEGTTQNINLFGSNSSGGNTTLKFNILGATWKNAIEFESGGSTGKETILRIDSNKGLKARNLNMDDTRINHLADPVQDTDAVNLQYMEGITDTLQNALATETQARIDGDAALSDAVEAEKNSRINADNQLDAKINANTAKINANTDKINAIDMALNSQGVFRKAPSTYPDDAGYFTMLNAGGSSTNTITGARTIWLADRNAAGTQLDIGSWNGDTVDFVDKDGETYVFPFTSKNSGAPNTNGITFWNFTVSSGTHSGGNAEMPSNQDYYLKLQGLAPPSPAVTTRNLKLENPSDTRILTDITTQADANEVFATALSGLVDEDLNPINIGSSASTLPEWTLAHYKEGESPTGKMAFFDNDFKGTDRLEDVRGIVFSAVDANGNRVGRTKDGVDWERDFGGVLNILYDEEKTIFSMARSHGSVSAAIYYFAELDAYSIIWVADKDAVVTSDVTHVNVDQNYKIHCPEIFF